MRKRITNQSGVSLLELMIAMAISLVVSLAMVVLMANTLGTGKETIEMTRLNSELRTALQIMSREVRRANYHANFMACFGNVDCRSDGSLESGAASYIKAVTIGTSVSANDCLYFWYDRNSNGDVTTDTNDFVGAFRRQLVNGVGVIEMTITDKTLASCTSGNWVQITDPGFVNITAFQVSNNLSYTDTISSAGDTQTVGKIGLSMTGQLRRDAAVVKTITDTIRVRNDIFTPAPNMTFSHQHYEIWRQGI